MYFPVRVDSGGWHGYLTFFAPDDSGRSPIVGGNEPNDLINACILDHNPMLIVDKVEGVRTLQRLRHVHSIHLGRVLNAYPENFARVVVTNQQIVAMKCDAVQIETVARFEARIWRENRRMMTFEQCVFIVFPPGVVLLCRCAVVPLCRCVDDALCVLREMRTLSGNAKSVCKFRKRKVESIPPTC